VTSSAILHEIGHVLAQQYGFTPEESALVLNYDIQCRMGHDAESEADA